MFWGSWNDYNIMTRKPTDILHSLFMQAKRVEVPNRRVSFTFSVDPSNFWNKCEFGKYWSDKDISLFCTEDCSQILHHKAMSFSVALRFEGSNDRNASNAVVERSAWFSFGRVFNSNCSSNLSCIILLYFNCWLLYIFKNWKKSIHFMCLVVHFYDGLLLSTRM